MNKLKRLISVAVAGVLLLSLCACGEGKPQKPLAIRYKGEMISLSSTQSQLEQVLGAPTSEKQPFVYSDRVDRYYLGSKDRIVYTSDHIFGMIIGDDKIEVAGIKVGDSFSKLKSYYGDVFEEISEGSYWIDIVEGEAKPISFIVLQGINDNEALSVKFKVSDGKVTEIAVVPNKGMAPEEIKDSFK